MTVRGRRILNKQKAEHNNSIRPQICPLPLGIKIPSVRLHNPHCTIRKWNLGESLPGLLLCWGHKWSASTGWLAEALVVGHRGSEPGYPNSHSTLAAVGILQQQKSTVIFRTIHLQVFLTSTHHTWHNSCNGWVRSGTVRVVHFSTLLLGGTGQHFVHTVPFCLVFFYFHYVFKSIQRTSEVDLPSCGVVPNGLIFVRLVLPSVNGPFFE